MMKTNQKETNKPDKSVKSDLTETFIEQTAAKTGDYLIKKAKNQLNKILFESNKIEETQSRLKLVRQRYDLQKSTFSKMSDWYAERPFWQKLAMATAIISAAVVAGLFVHVAVTALFATVAFGFCLTAHMALKEHAQSTSACNDKLCEDLDGLETNLSQRIESMRALEDKLKSTFSTLASNNVHLAEDEQQLRSELTQLSQQIDGLSRTNTDLTGTAQQLQALNKGLMDKLNMTHSQLQSSHQVMQAKTSELEKTNGKLLETDNRLNQGCDELESINTKIEQSIAEFNQLRDEVRNSIKNPPCSQRTDTLLSNADAAIAEFGELLRNPDILNVYQQSCRDRTDNSYNNTPR